MKTRSNHLRINLANGYTRDKAQMLKTQFTATVV